MQFRPHKPEGDLTDKFHPCYCGQAQSSCCECISVSTHYFGKAAKTVKQLSDQGFHVSMRIAGEQHHLEQFVIGKIFRSGCY